MLAIRFLRKGKKNQPAYKIVVVDSKKSSTAGRFLEQVGFYNPLTKEKVLNGERIKYWLSVGAKASGTVHNLLVSSKITEGTKKFKLKKSRKQEEVPAEPVKAEIPVEAPKQEIPVPTETPVPKESVTEEKPTEQIQENPVKEAIPAPSEEVKVEESKIENTSSEVPVEPVAEEVKPDVEISTKEINPEEPVVSETEDKKEI